VSRLTNLLLALSLGGLAATALSGCCWGQGDAATSGSTDAPAEVEEAAWPAMPTPGEAPEFAVPAATRFALANGIPVTLVTTGAVPLVELQLNIYTGGSADPGGKEGLAVITADMLNEGTTDNDALALERALQTLASDVGFGSALDYSYSRVNALEDKLEQTLALLAEMVSQPTFPQGDLERIIEDHQRSLLSSKDDLSTVGNRAMNKVLWGDTYIGRATGGTRDSLSALTREDVVAQHASAWTPGNAGLVVVSRLTQEQIQPILEGTIGAWAATGTAPVVEVTAPEPKTGVTVYWVDKPGQSQSYVGVGNIAPGFDAAVTPFLELGNHPLGGNFTARINMNLREDKGFTYGARSYFGTQKLGGQYRARATVKADTTAPSITEFLGELAGALGDKPITDEEHGRSVSSLVQGQPSSYERMAGVLSRYASADAIGMPADYRVEYAGMIAGVARDTAQAAFAKVVSRENLVILVVGDRAAAGPAVEELGFGPIVALDDEGNLVQE
jgi:zinc protease